MSNRIYEIVEEIATLSGTGRSKRKVRRIRWDNSRWDGNTLQRHKAGCSRRSCLAGSSSFVSGKQERNVLPEAFLFYYIYGAV